MFAEGHQARKADAARLGPVEHGGQQRAGLCDEGQVAGQRGGVRKAGVEPELGRHEPDAVGAEDAQQVRPRSVEHGLDSGLVQAGGKYHGGACASGGDLGNQPGHRGRWRADHGQAGGRGQVCGAGKARQAIDLFMVGVDGVHGATKGAAAQVAQHRGSHAAGAWRGAEDGHGIGIEQVIEVADAHRCNVTRVMECCRRRSADGADTLSAEGVLPARPASSQRGDQQGLHGVQPVVGLRAAQAVHGFGGVGGVGGGQVSQRGQRGQRRWPGLRHSCRRVSIRYVPCVALRGCAGGARWARCPMTAAVRRARCRSRSRSRPALRAPVAESSGGPHAPWPVVAGAQEPRRRATDRVTRPRGCPAPSARRHAAGLRPARRVGRPAIPGQCRTRACRPVLPWSAGRPPRAWGARRRQRCGRRARCTGLQMPATGPAPCRAPRWRRTGAPAGRAGRARRGSAPSSASRGMMRTTIAPSSAAAGLQRVVALAGVGGHERGDVQATQPLQFLPLGLVTFERAGQVQQQAHVACTQFIQRQQAAVFQGVRHGRNEAAAGDGSAGTASLFRRPRGPLMRIKPVDRSLAAQATGVHSFHRIYIAVTVHSHSVTPGGAVRCHARCTWLLSLVPWWRWMSRASRPPQKSNPFQPEGDRHDGHRKSCRHRHCQEDRPQRRAKPVCAGGSGIAGHRGACTALARVAGAGRAAPGVQPPHRARR